MICPRCGEPNPDNFRFCGMCGMVLEASKTRTASSAQAGDRPVALRIPANPVRAAVASAPQAAQPSSGNARPSISGPSLLGLDAAPAKGPTIDTLREKAFSGSTPTFLYEDDKPGRGRTLLLAVILAVLVAGIFVRYRYLGLGGETAKPEPATPASSGAASSGQTAQPSASTSTAAPAQSAPSNPPASTPAKTDEAAANPGSSAPKEQAALAKPVERATVPAKQSTKIKPSSQPLASAKAPADDSGSAAFRKGDAYLYGRGGVSENCEEAIKNLKAASVAGNAKARGTFGTMYATGHCVPRDLPTAYSWFAQALQADPNNQILEKDLTALWNQMTPPERQLATKLKQ